MTSNDLSRVSRPAAIALLLAIGAPTLAQPAPATGGYSVIDAKLSRSAYPYLTVETVIQGLTPKVTMSLPNPSTSRLVILDVTFKAKGDPNDMKELNPSDLEVQWAAGGVNGKSPMIGLHFSKDWIVMGSGKGVYFSMKPNTYEVFTFVPKASRQISVAQRQADGIFKVVKANIALPAGR